MAQRCVFKDVAPGTYFVRDGRICMKIVTVFCKDGRPLNAVWLHRAGALFCVGDKDTVRVIGNTLTN